MADEHAAGCEWDHPDCAMVALNAARARIVALEAERDEAVKQFDDVCVVCPACSHAGGADLAVRHIPPTCNDRVEFRTLKDERDALAAKFSKELTETLLAYDAKWQPVVDALAAKLADATAYCSGEFPCEASTSAAYLERESINLREENDALAAEAAGLRQLAWNGWEQAVLWEQTEHACDTQYDRLSERVARLVAAVTQHVCYKCHDAVGLRGMHADRPVGCRFCNPLRAAHAEWST